MTQDQLLSLVRALLQIAGTSLVARGVISAADWTTVMGAILMIVPVAWGLVVHGQTGTIAAAAKLAENPNSPVKAIIVESTVEGRELSRAVDSLTVMSAGTASAQTAARTLALPPLGP